MKPGAVCCGQGHNHIYFPRDFGFRGSAVPIADAVMRQNRDAYRAVNLPGHCGSGGFVAKEVEPPAEPEAGEPPAELESGKTRSGKIGPDPRREAAREAAKRRWADWASRKTADAGAARFSTKQAMESRKAATAEPAYLIADVG
jgi:hypothetical protein